MDPQAKVKTELGRAVANSRKLQAHIKTKKKDCVESVVELLNMDFALHFANQRTRWQTRNCRLGLGSCSTSLPCNRRVSEDVLIL